MTPSGQLQVIDELVTTNMGAVNFGKLLKQRLGSVDYRGKEVEIYGDPAGDQRAQTDETTPFQVLWAQGIEAVPCPLTNNDFTLRREAVVDFLSRLDFIGRPAFVIGPKAKMVRKGMAGGYKYKRVQVVGEQRFHDKPDKGRYSHPCEALQYAIIGAVGLDNIIGGYSKHVPDYSQTNRLIA
jgi:hypothetical protein